MIKDLPKTVIKSGHWIKLDEGEWVCSECSEHISVDERADGSIAVYPHCPYCMTEMKEE